MFSFRTTICSIIVYVKLILIKMMIGLFMNKTIFVENKRYILIRKQKNNRRIRHKKIK